MFKIVNPDRRLNAVPALRGIGHRNVPMKTLKRLLRDDRGSTAIEYSLIATLVGLAIVGAATGLGTNISGTFTNVANHL